MDRPRTPGIHVSDLHRGCSAPKMEGKEANVELVPGPYADDRAALDALHQILSKTKLARRSGRNRAELSAEGYAIAAALRVLHYNLEARRQRDQSFAEYLRDHGFTVTGEREDAKG